MSKPGEPGKCSSAWLKTVPVAISTTTLSSVMQGSRPIDSAISLYSSTKNLNSLQHRTIRAGAALDCPFADRTQTEFLLPALCRQAFQGHCKVPDSGAQHHSNPQNGLHAPADPTPTRRWYLVPPACRGIPYHLRASTCCEGCPSHKSGAQTGLTSIQATGTTGSDIPIVFEVGQRR